MTASQPLSWRVSIIATKRELAHGYLESAGVDSALHVDDAGGMDVGLAFVNPARIVVRAEDEERARQVLVDAGMLEGH